MKIAIDVSQVVFETGVSVYTKNLIMGLLSIDKVDKYLIFGGSLRKYDYLKNWVEEISVSSKRNCFHKTFHYPPLLADILWNKLHIFPIEKLIGDVDVFHSSDWTQPPSKAFKITTIHDLVPILYPKLSQPKLVSVHKRKLEIVKKEVDRIIVPSMASRNDLVKIGFDAGRIRVIPEAPDAIFQPQKRENVVKVKRKYRISGNYLLAVGVTPRKNIERVLNAFEKVKAEEKLKLVVVGHRYSGIQEGRGVIYLGHVPKNDLAELYSGSDALVYPSLYEGFGLPILEAFASRTAVVTSNMGSMKEVADDSAVLVDPYNINDIKDGIMKALKERKEYILRGKKRLTNFSWKKSAQMTLDVYKESLI